MCRIGRLVNTYRVIGNDGREYGPADLAKIRAWVAEGRIAASTRAQASGTTEWKPASSFPELGVGVPTLPPTLPPQARKLPGSTLPTSPVSRPVPSVVFLLAAVLVALAIGAAVMVLTGSHSRNPQTSSSSHSQMSRPPSVPSSPERSLEDQSDRQAAEQGDAEAQWRLGDSYANGIGVGQDYGEAAKWYGKAAEQGHTQAQYELGRLYAQGLGVARDYAEAAKWYRLAAEKGHVPAQHFLGHLYASGRGPETEYLEAPERQPTPPERAPPAQRNDLSDYAEAARWWRKAADQGDAAAQSDLGWLYTSGRGGETNYAEAASWYRKSAEQGNPNGQHWLGHCYLSGRGVAKDEVEASKWFREAADNGVIAAQRDLGRLYATGRGIEQNSAEAIKWFRKAAESGLPSAQNSFAWMLATSTNASLRNGRLAVTFAENAVAGTRRSDPSFLDTLAAAHAEAGNFEKAVAIQNEAIALLRDAASQQDYTSRLRLYQAKTPYREAEKE